MNNLVPNIIFTSVLDRSINTANIIKKEILRPDQDIPIHTSWRLNEKHYGTIEGLPRQIIRDDYGDKFTDLIRNNFFTKPPIIFKISVLKSNKLTGFGISSFKITVLESNTLTCFGLSLIIFVLFCFKYFFSLKSNSLL